MQITAIISSVVALAAVAAAGPLTPRGDRWHLRMYTHDDFDNKIVDRSEDHKTDCVNLPDNSHNDAVTSIHWRSGGCNLILYRDFNCDNKLHSTAQDWDPSQLDSNKNNKISSWKITDC